MSELFKNRWASLYAMFLFIALLLLSEWSSLMVWVEILFTCIGFYCCLYCIQSLPKKGRFTIRLVLLILVLVIWLTQNHILALYLIGTTYLLAVFLCVLFMGSIDKKGKKAIYIIAISISIALLATPITVSRIETVLLTLPVPSKFSIRSDPNANLRHFASRGFPHHHLGTMSFTLSANNPSIDEPMPWLKFQGRRDTHFPIYSIFYKFYLTTLHAIHATQLHDIELIDQQGNVRLEKTDNGIVISDIGGGEYAWIKVPDIDHLQLALKTKIKIALMKVSIWWIIFAGFLVWAPVIRSQFIKEQN